MPYFRIEKFSHWVHFPTSKSKLFEVMNWECLVEAFYKFHKVWFCGFKSFQMNVPIESCSLVLGTSLGSSGSECLRIMKENYQGWIHYLHENREKSNSKSQKSTSFSSRDSDESNIVNVCVVFFPWSLVAANQYESRFNSNSKFKFTQELFDRSCL